ncbi:uncharacterized protein [Dysidea avara]|uniref:uncharacterized protein n=1 Tax=Dysidea avara TaxID=196820 RepID=UPI003331A16D
MDSEREGVFRLTSSSVKEKITAYQQGNNVQLAYTDSRTLDAARKRAPKRIQKANGKPFHSKGSGQRPCHSTIKQNCKACIKLNLSEDGQYLEITDVCNTHNHEVSKAIYDHLPRQRKLTPSERNEAAELLTLRVNNKLLQQHLSQSTGKIVTLKDISNIKHSIRKMDGNDLEKLSSYLKAIEGSTVEFLCDEDKNLVGIVFQDGIMKSTFSAFPEVLLVDATYKLTELRMPVYLMMVVDGNGQSEIVCAFVTVLETEESMGKMIQVFKSHNPAWASSRVLISDKDCSERAVFAKEFPGICLQLCLFHVLRSFRREITCDKMGIRAGERDHALEILLKLAYSRSESDCNHHYEDLRLAGLTTVFTYYNDNWHPIQEEWVECFKNTAFTLGKRTNNRLESINAKVKSVCARYSTLMHFFEHFCALLSTLRNERDHCTLMAMVKKRIDMKDPVEIEYSSVLTPYALNYVSKQLSLRRKVIIFSEHDRECHITSSEGILKVTVNGCHCAFWNTTNLPCRHIFAVQERKKHPLFTPLLLAECWTKDYMRDAYYKKSELTVEASSSISSIGHGPQRSCLTQHQKYHKSHIVAVELASLSSEVGMTEFTRRYTLLQTLRDVWASGRDAILCAAQDQHCSDQRGTVAVTASQSLVGCVSEGHSANQNARNEGSQAVENAGTCTTQSDAVCSNSSGSSTSHGDNESDGTRNSEVNTTENHLLEKNDHHDQELQSIRLPSKMRKRGRPKGSDKTVIGLPRKKSRGSRPVSFLYKGAKQKELVILTWFVDLQIAKDAIDGSRIIEEYDVEMRPEMVSSSCTDENVCLDMCRKYCTREAWAAINSVVSIIQANPTWYCGR